MASEHSTPVLKLIPEAEVDPTDSDIYLAEHRRKISEHGNAADAIHNVLGTFDAILGQAQMLQQDCIRCEEGWVLAIADAIVELAENARGFLDRRGGWLHEQP
jgi:hypothetical protein